MNGGSSHIYHILSDTVVLLFVIDTSMSVIQYLYLCVTPGVLMQKQHLWSSVFTSSFTRFPCYYAVMLSAQCALVSSSQLFTSNSVLASGCSSFFGCCVDTVVVVAVWTQCRCCVDRVFVDIDINFVTTGHDRFSLNQGTS